MKRDVKGAAMSKGLGNTGLTQYIIVSNVKHVASVSHWQLLYVVLDCLLIHGTENTDLKLTQVGKHNQ
jgi:hypothetical protein